MQPPRPSMYQTVAGTERNSINPSKSLFSTAARKKYDSIENMTPEETFSERDFSLLKQQEVSSIEDMSIQNASNLEQMRTDASPLNYECNKISHKSQKPLLHEKSNLTNTA